ncbi:hypothetical protein [Marivita hallyeonensis]|nr:hypothetical protein [Marivita hallyeonensis]
MKTARPWVGHLPGQWGGIEFEELVAVGAVDANGWPTHVPDPARRLEALILTDQPEEAEHLSGDYHVFYKGEATIEIKGLGRTKTRRPGHIVFSYRPGEGSVGISVQDVDPSDPLRNISVVHADYLDAHANGELFHPLWLSHLKGVETLRFMDWMDTNNSPVANAAQIAQADDFSYGWRGVPLGVMIALANQIEANPWFTIPHQADDALVRQFAEDTVANLDPGRAVYVEYSNEVWNFIFEQSRWAQAQAEKLWGEQGDGWVQYYGLRAAQIMDIWADVFAEPDHERLNRVIAVHTGWPELEQSMLFGKHATQELGRSPAESFDAYAVTGYFGHDVAVPGIMHPLLDAAQEQVEADGKALGLSRVALREYVRPRQFEPVFARAADMIRQGSLRELEQDVWPYHARVARDLGLDLIMYEGGTHATPQWSDVDDERLVSFLLAFNYSENMGALYEQAIASWEEISGSSFHAFVDVAPPSKWGSWGALRHLNDDNPRWRSLRRQLDQAGAE